MPVSSQWFANPGVTYEIDQSIRFNDDDSAYLNRTPGSAGNRRTWTFSCWVKRGNITGANGPIFTAGADDWLQFLSGNTLGFNSDGSSNYRIVTSQLFRDPAAWFHVVLRIDTTNSTAGDRERMYINGSEVTDFGADTNPPLNYDTAFNNTGEHSIGKTVGSSQFFDGYLAEMHHVDGSSLAPSSFGETNDDGVWVPKAYSGSYGTTGFYLKGQDSSALGDDTSGNGSDFSSNNLAAADQMSDSPTNNHCTYSPLRIRGTNTLSNGNLQAAAGSAGAYVTSTFGVSSGKWYWEYTFTGTYNFPIVGVMDTTLYEDAYPSQLDRAVLYYSSNGNKYVDSTGSSYGASYAVSDKIGVALNLDDNEITFYKNNSTQGDISITNRNYTPLAGEEGSSNGGIIANFGQSDFEYTPPTGFSALSTANLADPQVENPSAYFHTQLYTGNDTSGHSITNNAQAGDFQPDWIIFAPRSNGDHHNVIDAVRGSDRRMQTNNTTAEQTDDPALFTFESNGFDIDTTDVNYNGSGRTYVAWQWKANGSGSSNEDGSINTTATSANTTAGFSISTFTGNGTSGATFGHGLGAAPKFVIVKERDPGGNNWMVGLDALGWTKYLALDSNQAVTTSSARWNDTAPTSTVVTLGDDTGINANTATYVAYCFAEVDGFSKFGAYEGNSNADGSFIYTGFRPAWITLKEVDNADDWVIYDTKRDPINIADTVLRMDTNASEYSGSGREIDILSNGFKIRTSNATINASNTYAYLAFAEFPLKYANAR